MNKTKRSRITDFTSQRFECQFFYFIKTNCIFLAAEKVMGVSSCRSVEARSTAPQFAKRFTARESKLSHNLRIYQFVDADLI